MFLIPGSATPGSSTQSTRAICSPPGKEPVIRADGREQPIPPGGQTPPATIAVSLSRRGRGDATQEG